MQPRRLDVRILGGLHGVEASGQLPELAKDGDGNYLATCRAREPQASGTIVNVVGKAISITVLSVPCTEGERPERRGGRQQVRSDLHGFGHLPDAGTAGVPAVKFAKAMDRCKCP